MADDSATNNVKEKFCEEGSKSGATIYIRCTILGLVKLNILLHDDSMLLG